MVFPRWWVIWLLVAGVLQSFYLKLEHQKQREQTYLLLGEVLAVLVLHEVGNEDARAVGVLGTLGAWLHLVYFLINYCSYGEHLDFPRQRLSPLP